MINDYITEYKDMVLALSAEYQRKYSMLEREDIYQELWLWFASHTRKYKEWSELPTKDKERLIAKSLRNAALKYCEKEKARIAGYDTADVYYYDAAVVEAVLPSIIAGTYSIPVLIQDVNARYGGGNPAEGNNWIALRSDISAGFDKLPEDKQNILRLRFSMEQPDWATLAVEMNSTPDGARMKVHRAVLSLIKNLGGWKPYNEQEETNSSADEADSDTTEE